MCASAYQEAKRQLRFQQRKKEALTKLAERTGEWKRYSSRAQPTEDYPHDVRKDMFAVGAFNDRPVYHKTDAELFEHLYQRTRSSRKLAQLYPAIFSSLRRRARKLEDNLLFMGPYSSFYDYFEDKISREESCGSEL